MSIQIRFALNSDLENIIDLCSDYGQGGDILGLNIPINRDRIKESVIFNFHNVIVLILDGVIIGAIVGNVVNCECTADTVFMAMLLYVKKAYRRYTKYFLQGADKLSREKDATMFLLVAPNFKDRKRLERFYSILGYRLLESHYVKKVGV